MFLALIGLFVTSAVCFAHENSFHYISTKQKLLKHPQELDKMSSKSYLLYISVSPQDEKKSYSRQLGNLYLEEWTKKFPDILVIQRDLRRSPLDHLDEEAIDASYLPADERTPEMQAKHQLRLDLIEEIVNSKAILVSLPKYNWNVPSSFKAYIDHIVLPGVLDNQTQQRLAGKPVTVLLATGGGDRAADDLPIQYVKLVFSFLGATDIEVIRTEFGLAGVLPGTQNKIPRRRESFAAAEALVLQRVGNLSIE